MRRICAVITVLVTGACQTVPEQKTVSIQEAEQLSAKFENLSLRVPERKLYDPRLDPFRIRVFEDRFGTCDTINEDQLNDLFSKSQYYRNTIAILKNVHKRGRLVLQNDAEREVAKEWEIDVYPAVAQSISKSFERLGNMVPAAEWMDIAIQDSRSEWGKVGASELSLLAYQSALTGDIEQAETVLSRARTSGLRSVWNRFWYTRGNASILEAKGLLEEAVFEFNSTRRQLLGIHPQGHVRYARLTSHIGNIRLKQGRLVEAEALLIDALAYKFTWQGRTHSIGIESAMPIRNAYSNVLYEQGRYEDAATIAKLNLSLMNQKCVPLSSVYRAEARNNLARAFMALGQWDDAVDQFEKLEMEFSIDRKTYEARFQGSPDHALSLIRTGRAKEAVPLLETRAARLTDVLGGRHYDTVESRAFLAAALTETGDNTRALALFRGAIPLMLQRSRQSETQAESANSITFKRRALLESYLSLLTRIQGTGLDTGLDFDATSEAFRIADVARSSTVEQLLARSSARSAMLDPELAELARKEQNLQRQISSQWSSLSTGNRNQVLNDQSATEMRARIDELRTARASIMQEIERRFPDYAKLINPKRIGTATIHSLLKPNERLLSVYVGESRTWVWSVPDNGDVAMYAIDIDQAELAAMVDQVRAGLDPAGVTLLREIPRFDVDAGHRLFTLLFGEDRHRWRDGESLIYIPQGALSTLPLATLPVSSDGNPRRARPLYSEYAAVDWLIRHHAVATLPSVASLKSLREATTTRTSQLAFAGFGDPVFAPDAATGGDTAGATRGLALRSGGVGFRSALQTTELRSAGLGDLPQLPDTRDEIDSMALAMNADPTRDLYLGPLASEANVKGTDLSRYRVLAFATHGLVSGDLDGLREPALALSAPEVTGGDEDGLLTMDEIMALRLDADWVVLSACNTGAADGTGAEAVSGLGGAFFYAGARALLVTYWPVETTSARELTTDLFRRQADDSALDRSQALKETWNNLIDGPGYQTDDGTTVFSYAHPIFWGAFGLIGLPRA